jgi:predicted nucleotide-binding protein
MSAKFKCVKNVLMLQKKENKMLNPKLKEGVTYVKMKKPRKKSLWCLVGRDYFCF